MLWNERSQSECSELWSCIVPLILIATLCGTSCVVVRKHEYSVHAIGRRSNLWKPSSASWLSCRSFVFVMMRCRHCWVLSNKKTTSSNYQVSFCIVPPISEQTDSGTWGGMCMDPQVQYALYAEYVSIRAQSIFRMSWFMHHVWGWRSHTSSSVIHVCRRLPPSTSPMTTRRLRWFAAPGLRQVR